MTAITLKRIDQEINLFTTDRNKLMDRAQAIASMIFLHAAPKAVSTDCNGTGDCTRALVLAKAMPTSWAEQLIKWFAAFTPIRVNVGNERVGFDLKYMKLTPEEKKAQMLDWWKLEEANTTDMFTLNKEREVEVKLLSLEDLIKMASQLGNRIEKILNDEDERRSVKPEDVEPARTFARMLESIKVDRVKPASNSNDQTAPETVAA